MSDNEKQISNSNDRTIYDKEQRQNPWNAAFVFMVAVIYLVLPACTFSMGSVNTPAQLIKDFINSSYLERNGKAMSSSDIETLFGLLVAVVGLGAGLGSLLASYIIDSVGRKNGIIIASLITIVATLIMAFSKVAESYEMIFVGRVMVGVSLGLASTIAPTYAVEICVPEIKYQIAFICQLIQAFAVLCANVAGFEELLGTPELWPYLLALPGMLCAMQLLLIPFCPESPRYLLMKKNNLKDATKAFQFIRGKQDVEDDIKELHRELEESKLQSQVSMMGIFRVTSLRRPLVVAFVIGWYQSWSGVDGILFFSTQLFQGLGMVHKVAKYATSGTGLMFFLGNIVSPVMMKRYERKTLFHIGVIGMGVCSVVIAFTMKYSNEIASLRYINVVASLAHIFFYSVGPVCLFWVILAEMFPHSARGAGLGIGVQNAYLGFFVYCYVFPEMLIGIGTNSFFIFAAINALMVVFVHFVVPETKNKSVSEILKLSPDTVDVKLESDEIRTQAPVEASSIMTRF